MKLKTYIRVIMIALVATLSAAYVVADMAPQAAYAEVAGGGFVMSPNGPNLFQSQNEVVRGTSGSAASTGDYPWNSDPRKVGIDSKAGYNLTEYVGEVPSALKKEKGCKNLYFYSGKIKDGSVKYERVFQDREECDGADTLQYKALSNNQGNFFGSIFSVVTSSFVWLAQQLNYLLLWIKSLDLIAFIDGASGGLLDSIRKIIIWNENGPAIPLIIALSVFIVSFIPTIWRFVKGTGGGQVVWNKLGVLALSFLLIGAAMSNTPQLMNKWSSDFAGSMQKSLVESSTGTNGVSCSYQTNDERNDSIRTIYCGQMMPTFENGILNQFGYSSNSLNVEDFPNYKGALSDAFGNDSNGNPINPFKDIPNLGWYWANGQTKITSGNDFSSSKTTSADNYRVVLIIDFLDALKNQTGNVEDQALQDKVNTMANSLTSPNYGSHGVNNLLLIIFYLLNLVVMVNLTAFVLVGIVSVSLIGVIIIATPVLVYFKPELVKDILKTYIMGFLRLLLGSVLTIMYVTLTAVLFAGDFYAAIAVSIVLGFTLAKFGPRLLRQLNQEISKHETFAPVRAMNREMNKMIYNRGGSDRAKADRKKNRSEISENRMAINAQQGKIDDLDDSVENEDVEMITDAQAEAALSAAQAGLAGGTHTQNDVDAAMAKVEASRQFVDSALMEEARNTNFHDAHDLGHLTAQQKNDIVNGSSHLVLDPNTGQPIMVDDATYQAYSSSNRPKTISLDSDVSSLDAVTKAEVLAGGRHLATDKHGNVITKTSDEANELMQLSGGATHSKTEAKQFVQGLQVEIKKAKKKVLFKGVINEVGSVGDNFQDSHNEVTATVAGAKRVFGRGKKGPRRVTFNEKDW